MTTNKRSSILEFERSKSGESLINSSSTEAKLSVVDALLNADKSGFLGIGINSSMISSRLNSTGDLSESFSVSLEKSMLEAKIKRAFASTEAMESTVKRIRTETNHSIEDLQRKNELLDGQLNESRIKLIEAELVIEQYRSNEKSAKILEQQIQIFEFEKKQMEIERNQLENSHMRKSIELETTITRLKHQIVDAENKLTLIEFDNQQMKYLNEKQQKDLEEKSQEIDHLQIRITELENMLINNKRSDVINESILHDINRLSDLRYENQRLKEEIELLKLKCSDRIRQDEEIRSLRKQVETNEEYRSLIAKQNEEIHKLREQLKVTESSSFSTVN